MRSVLLLLLCQAAFAQQGQSSYQPQDVPGTIITGGGQIGPQFIENWGIDWIYGTFLQGVMRTPGYSLDGSGNLVANSVSMQHCFIGGVPCLLGISPSTFLGIPNVFSAAFAGGAFADGKQGTYSVTATSGNKNVTVAGGAYTASDVGKVFRATGLGATLTTGTITSIPITGAGTVYTAIPTIGISGTTATALAYAQLQVSAASVAGANSVGCPNGTQSFTVQGGGAQDTWAVVSGTVTGGVLGGALTVTTPGAYTFNLPTLAGQLTKQVSTAGGTCSTLPTVSLTMNLGAVWISDGGMVVPTAGVTAALSGGGYSTPATLGTVVVTPTISVLSTTISGVTDATHITLADAPQTSQAATNETVFYGHDDLPALQAAVNSCQDVLAPSISATTPATYWISGPVLLPTTCNAKFHGSGRTLTEIELMPGVNSDIIETSGFYSLSGTNSNGGSAYVELNNLWLNGNSAAQQWPSSACQTSNSVPFATPDCVNGIAYYGEGPRFEHLYISNVLGHGMRTEWTSGGGTLTPRSSMEGFFHDIVIDTVGRNGWWNEGPHDSYAADIIMPNPSQEEDNTYYGYLSAPTTTPSYPVTNGFSSARIVNFHAWHAAPITNRMAADMNSGGGTQVTTSNFEGGRAWVIHSGNGDSISNSSFYAPFAFAGASLINFTGSRTVHDGNTYGASTAAPQVQNYAMEYTSQANQIVVSGDSFNGFTSGPFNFVSEFGNDIIVAQGAGNASSGAPYSGTIASTDVVIYSDPNTPFTQLGVTEYYAQCPVNSSTAGVSVTNTGSPSVFTWGTSPLPAQIIGANAWTCPLYFTVAPTGLSTSTVYWMIGSTVNGLTFELADTQAHALAGTNPYSIAGTSGTASLGYLPAANSTAYSSVAMNVPPGFWVCNGHGDFYGTSTQSTTSQFTQGINTSITNDVPNIGITRRGYTTYETAAQTFPNAFNHNAFGPITENLSATTTLYGIDFVTSGGYATFNEGGDIDCIRY